MPTFDSNNGVMMEGEGGASVLDVRVRDGKRLSVFRTYVFPFLDRPNLTVLTRALVTKLVLDRNRVTGVEVACDGKVHRITAGFEVVLALGAIHTPKVLMLSGIGNQAELRQLGIPVVTHLPGVGRNFQDHFGGGVQGKGAKGGPSRLGVENSSGGSWLIAHLHVSNAVQCVKLRTGHVQRGFLFFFFFLGGEKKGKRWSGAPLRGLCWGALR